LLNGQVIAIVASTKVDGENKNEDRTVTEIDEEEEEEKLQLFPID
jgi:hypothetical protein